MRSKSPLCQPPLITLTTDFGRDSHYVAQLKGVILGLCRDAQIVDVSHDVSPQNVAEAGWLLRHSIDAFPADTCHVAVVDPGVGTSRRILLARLADQYFIAPDNGLLWPLASRWSPEWVRQLTDATYWRADPSPTFHGRDIMAPVAAALTRGTSVERFGPLVDRVLPLKSAEVTQIQGRIRGEIVYIDRFGNLITNISEHELRPLPRPIVVQIASRGFVCERYVATYAEAAAGTTVALVGSTGQLEVAVVNGNAAGRLGAAVGDHVEVSRKLGPDPAAENTSGR